jgi:hypothetical protein
MDSVLLPKQLHRIGSIALGVLVAALVVGCSGPTDPEPQFFNTALPQELDQPLPVVLGDQTGLVTAIGPATDPQGNTGLPVVLADPSDPMAFVITWLGGPCEKNAALSFTRKEGGYLLHLTASQNTECPLIGYPRGVRIVTSTAIPVGSIEVIGRG